MKFHLLLPIALLVLTQSACNQPLKHQVASGVDASDDELLATLASLAKRGSEAVCNPSIVEKELGIKLGEFKVDKTPSLAGEPREARWTDTVSRSLSGKSFAIARYYRSRSVNGSGCGLIINFLEERLCYPTTKHLEQIMNTPVLEGPAKTHGTGYGYIFKYAPNKNELAEVWVGQSDGSCSSGFRLTTNGEWK